MNGDFKKVHSDRLKTQSESQKSCCSSKMYCSLSLFAILNILVCMDVFIRLKLTSFGILLFCIFHFLRIARDLAVQPNKVPPALDVERILGEIIHSFWVTDVVENKGTLSYLIVKYTFEGVTYQATYLDDTWGLLATEKYMELIVNRANPKEPLSALQADFLNRHHQDSGTNRGLLEDAFSWFVTIVVVMFVVLPLFAIPADCKTYDLDCTPTVWMDAILHYLIILGINTLYFSYLVHEFMKKVQANLAAIAPERIEKPFVPEAGIIHNDNVLHVLIPATSHACLYLATGSISVMVWMLYASFECGISLILYVPIALYSLWLAYDWAAIIIDYLYLQPIQTMYQNEGILPKNITVLKSGGLATNLTSIIQYDVDITDSDRFSQTLTTYAQIKTGDEHRLLILPSEPTTAFVPEAPPPKSWQTIAMLVASPLGVINFYTWKENTSVLEKCLFAVITSTLFVISSACFAMAPVSSVHNPSAGKRGSTVVFPKNGRLYCHFNNNMREDKTN